MAIEQPTRRGLITGLGAFFCAAPAIVRATSIMPVHAIEWHAATGIDYGFVRLRCLSEFCPCHSEFHVSEIAFWSQPPPVGLRLLWDEP
jgi:hypothetical protein